MGYRWYETQGGTPAWAFGYGLSYTTFALSNATVTSSSAAGVSVSVNVTNTGDRSGTETVQGYLNYPTGYGEPPEQLKAFGQITLAAGQSGVVTLTVPATGFRVWQNGTFITPSGAWRLDIGDSSANLTWHVAVTAPQLAPNPNA